jgi:hypothetical protein
MHEAEQRDVVNDARHLESRRIASAALASGACSTSATSVPSARTTPSLRAESSQSFGDRFCVFGHLEARDRSGDIAVV